MKRNATQSCAQHPSRFDCPDALIEYFPRLGEYGLIIHDGGQSVVTIAFCPFCGAKLPTSRTDD